MKKIPFEQLEIQVDYLFRMKIDHANEQEVEERISIIIDLIEFSGWTVEDYVIKMLNLNLLN